MGAGGVGVAVAGTEVGAGVGALGSKPKVGEGAGVVTAVGTGVGVGVEKNSLYLGGVLIALVAKDIASSYLSWFPNLTASISSCALGCGTDVGGGGAFREGGVGLDDI